MLVVREVADPEAVVIEFSVKEFVKYTGAGIVEVVECVVVSVVVSVLVGMVVVVERVVVVE